MSYITAVVIQTTDEVLVSSSTGVVGSTMLIATPNSGGQIDSDYWAVPVTNFGIVGTGFKYVPCQPADTVKPSAQSFHVIRLINQNNAGNQYVLGTSTQYIAASKEAESNTTSSPAVVMPLASTLPIFAPCQVMCNQDTNGLYFAVLGAPNQLGSPPVFLLPQGYLNEVALPTANSLGYSNPTTLLTFLNTPTTGWAAVGTWTKSADGLTFTATQSAGSGTDVLCAKITTVS